MFSVKKCYTPVPKNNLLVFHEMRLCYFFCIPASLCSMLPFSLELAPPVTSPSI